MKGFLFSVITVSVVKTLTVSSLLVLKFDHKTLRRW